MVPPPATVVVEVELLRQMLADPLFALRILRRMVQGAEDGRAGGRARN